MKHVETRLHVTSAASTGMKPLKEKEIYEDIILFLQQDQGAGSPSGRGFQLLSQKTILVKGHKDIQALMPWMVFTEGL